MWPNGVLADSLPQRSDEEKLRTRIKAKEKFLQNQPGNTVTDLQMRGYFIISLYGWQTSCNTELNDLRIIFCLRNSEIIVKRISVCNVI